MNMQNMVKNMSNNMKINMHNLHNMQAAHQVGKEFDKISQTHTNRLEDSEIQLSD